MTDDAPKPKHVRRGSGPTSQAAKLSDAARPPNDWILQSFVRLVNSSGGELGITLVYGGTLISGMLVSGRSYIEGIAAEFEASVADPGVGKSLRTMLTTLGSAYFEEPAEKDPLPEFLHLRDARIFSPGQPPIPTAAGIWWRGRISQVGGFSFGQLSTS